MKSTCESINLFLQFSVAYLVAIEYYSVLARVFGGNLIEDLRQRFVRNFYSLRNSSGIELQPGFLVVSSLRLHTFPPLSHFSKRTALKETVPHLQPYATHTNRLQSPDAVVKLKLRL